MSWLRSWLTVVACLIGTGDGAGRGTPGQAFQPATEESKPAALPPGCLRQLGEVRLINIGHVLALAFAPDGKTLAAGSWDDTVRLWNVVTGKEIRKLEGHDHVKSLAFSPDAKTVVTHGHGRDVRLWDAVTGNLLQALQFPDQVWGITLAPNGKLLAVNVRGRFRICDITSRKEVFRNQYRDIPVGFTPDNDKVITLSYREQNWVVLFRDAETGKERRHFATGQETVGYLAISPNGRTLLFNRWPKLFLFDLATGRMRQSAKPPEDRVRYVNPIFSSSAFSSNGKMFAFLGENDAIIHVWETATLQERCRFQGHEIGRIPLAFSPDGTILASGSTDRTVLLWDVPGFRTGRIETGIPAAKELEALWTDLASPDAARAYRAMGRMLASPESSLAYLKKQIQPAAVKVELVVIDRLIGALASEQFSVRQQAGEALGKLGEPAEPFFRQALAKSPKLEVRRRLEQLLARIEDARANPSPGHLRIIRAVELVETIGTKEARLLLERWAKGTPAVLLTREGADRLENLTRRALSKPAK